MQSDLQEELVRIMRTDIDQTITAPKSFDTMTFKGKDVTSLDGSRFKFANKENNFGTILM